MYILVMGLNFRTASIDVRERFTFRNEELPYALQQLKQTKRVLECVLIATCNRTELYVVVDQIRPAKEYLRDFLAQWFEVAGEKISPYLYTFEQELALQHLFRVTCGLDSLVLGETQILGQIRDSFLMAQQLDATGTWFNRLFKQAITAAKRIHTETELGEHPVSVSYAALEMARHTLKDLQDKSVLILGAGKMSELTAKHLCSHGVRDVIIANRTFERAQELAKRFGGVAIEWEKRSSALNYVDLVVSSTSSGEYVLSHQDVCDAMIKRIDRPMVVMDLGLPRDLDPSIASIHAVHLSDLDALQGVIDSNLAVRKAVAKRVESWIDSEVEQFQQWIAMQGVVPVMQALQEKTERIHEEMMTSLQAKLPDLDERELKIIRKLSKSLINQTLKDPILRLKELAGTMGQQSMIYEFEKLFSLEQRTDELRANKPITSSEVMNTRDAL